uniref:Glutamate-rich protein 1 n=1 Tax=Malurus cyaneus samueli TaxID=2593467 RepID=A0A8C5U696_9PASS
MLITDLVIYSSHVSFKSAEEEYQGQTKRKRIRRKKQKSKTNKSLQISSNLHGEQTDTGMQEAVVQDNLQLQKTDHPKISKNKKRKMKKKRQKEKKRAAGLVTKTTGVDFTYQPDKNNREEAAGLKDLDEKADSILDFLQATQQIYFADSMYQSFSFLFMSITRRGKWIWFSYCWAELMLYQHCLTNIPLHHGAGSGQDPGKEAAVFEKKVKLGKFCGSLNIFNIFSVFPEKSECRDAAVNSATAQELLQCLESRTISSSDLTHLHRLKSLVLLQDIERLKDALKQFQEQSTMSPGGYHSLMFIY